MLIGGKIGFPF